MHSGSRAIHPVAVISLVAIFADYFFHLRPIEVLGNLVNVAFLNIMSGYIQVVF